MSCACTVKRFYGGQARFKESGWPYVSPEERLLQCCHWQVHCSPASLPSLFARETQCRAVATWPQGTTPCFLNSLMHDSSDLEPDSCNSHREDTH